MMPGGASRVPDPDRVREILPAHLPPGLLSIAVFGPGEGEAIVVRLPDGSVGVVDGCREPDPKHPRGYGDPVRELLARIKDDPATAKPFRLRFVCLTHPHDDHYAGVGRLLQAYEGHIEHVWTVAHVTERFAKPLSEWIDDTRGGKDPMPDDKNPKGLERVIAGFHGARTHHGACPNLLQAGQSLLNSSHGGSQLTITACGPASGDLQDASIELNAALLALGRDERARRSINLNLVSGALVIRWGASAVLLAGDLLTGKGPHSGWNLARNHLDHEVQVVNVAHHASEGAHHDRLWALMQPRLAIVTPFRHGSEDGNHTKYPPRPEQIAALAASSVVAITSPPRWRAAKDHPRGLRPPPPRRAAGKNGLLPITTADAYRNAVAVSLDAAGNITHLVLAGAADIYEPPAAQASTAGTV